MILISACLCDVNCRYNGKSNTNEKVYELFKEGKAILVCPEQLGGLSTPRPPAEIKNGCNACEVLRGKGQVINNQGEDVTAPFIKGAQEALKIAKAINCTKAILKSRSPSCGCGQVYDGTFQKQLIQGNGVLTELLLQNGIEVLTEEDF